MFTKTMQEYITKTVTANSEEDYDYLLLLMSPTDDRDEMGVVYQNTLGYDPITYFDERFLNKSFDELLLEAPSSIKDDLTKERENIIKNVMKKRNVELDGFLLNLLTKEIYNEVGWVPYDSSEFGDDFVSEDDDFDDDDDIDEFDDEDDDDL